MNEALLQMGAERRGEVRVGWRADWVLWVVVVEAHGGRKWVVEEGEERNERN